MNLGVTFFLAVTTVLLSKPAPPVAAAGVDARRRTPLVRVVEQVRDSIVNISASGRVNVPYHDIFDLFFERQRRRTVFSVGSGFVIHESGYIVTNAHVVDASRDLRAAFANGEEYEATTLVSDRAHDLAILRIRPERPVVPIPMGRSDDLMPGESVIAIGNPLGYANTVTSGIVSALGRRIEFSPDLVYEDLIQTDAAINPGNSGGPLLNILGELVGINTAIKPGAENIGFAIPVDRLRALLPAMLDTALAEERNFPLGHADRRLGESASRRPRCRQRRGAGRGPRWRRSGPGGQPAGQSRRSISISPCSDTASATECLLRCGAGAGPKALNLSWSRFPSRTVRLWPWTSLA